MPKFRLKQRKFSTLKLRIKWVKTEKSGQNLGYDTIHLGCASGHIVEELLIFPMLLLIEKA